MTSSPRRVASRIFAYSNLAAYEVLSKEGHHYATLEGKIKSLKQHSFTGQTGAGRFSVCLNNSNDKSWKAVYFFRR